MTINGIELTTDTITLARQQFADNCNACVAEAISGEVRVNDLNKYIDWQNDMREASLRGDYDHTLAFLQRALYIQTGQMIAILS